MSQMNDTFNPFDPTGMVKSMRDASMEAWAKTMIQFVNTDTYAQSTGALLDAWLTNSGPFRKQLEAAMAQALANLNLPSRDDLTRLAERLTNIEMRLDDLDARLDKGPRPHRRGSAAAGIKSSTEESKS
jgi:hypothetical protein